MLNYFDDDDRAVQKTVLIVDDNQELLVNLAKQCKAIGLSVLTASDAVSAAKLMDQQFPALLLIDAEMPAGNGKTFLERLEANSETQGIPAIVLCKNADMNSIARVPKMVAYYVHKSERAWNTIEMFIHELVDLKASPSNESKDDENPLNLNEGAQ